MRRMASSQSSSDSAATRATQSPDVAQVLVADLLDRGQALQELLGELGLVLVGDDGVDAGRASAFDVSMSFIMACA